MRYLLLLLIMCCSTAYAGREDRIQALMEAQGLLQMLEQQLAYQTVEVARQGKIIEEQFMSVLNPSPEFRSKFGAATQEMMQSLVGVFTAREIVSAWSRFYGEQFTDQEIEDLIKYYTSPLGRKDVASSQAAMVKLNALTTQKMTPAVQGAIEAYIAKLKLIAKECQCRR